MMIKRIFLVCGFILFFAFACSIVFYMQQPSEIQASTKAAQPQSEQDLSQNAESLHSYTIENITEGCSAEDKIFCAVERVVKCTIAPTLSDCDKNLIPAFIVEQAQDTDRPTEISFKFTKIKPIPESSDLSIYTQSDCNAMWFGLCKGTVVYSLTPNNNGNWSVTNIFALE